MSRGYRSEPEEDTATFDPESAFGIKRDRCGAGPALFFEDAGGQRKDGISLEHRDGPLRDDGAVVVVVVGKMDGAAETFAPVSSTVLVHF